MARIAKMRLAQDPRAYQRTAVEIRFSGEVIFNDVRVTQEVQTDGICDIESCHHGEGRVPAKDRALIAKVQAEMSRLHVACLECGDLNRWSEIMANGYSVLAAELPPPSDEMIRRMDGAGFDTFGEGF